MDYVKGYLQDTAAGYLKTGLTAAGTMAGNAVGGVGGLIEGSGRSVGDGVSGGIGGVGNYINGYGTGLTNSFAADGPVGGTQKKTAVKAPAGPKAPSTAPKALPARAPKALSGSPSMPRVGSKPPLKPSNAASTVRSPVHTPGAVRRDAPSNLRPTRTSPATVKTTPLAGKTTISAGGASAASKPLPKTLPKGVTDGKKTISAASRPKQGVKK